MINDILTGFVQKSVYLDVSGHVSSQQQIVQLSRTGSRDLGLHHDVVALSHRDLFLCDAHQAMNNSFGMHILAILLNVWLAENHNIRRNIEVAHQCLSLMKYGLHALRTD